MLYDVDGHAAKDTARPWIGQWQTDPSSCVSLSNTKSTSMARSPYLSTLVVQFRQMSPDETVFLFATCPIVVTCPRFSGVSLNCGDSEKGEE